MLETKSDLQQEITNQELHQDNELNIDDLSLEEIEQMDVSDLENLDKKELVSVVLKCAQFSGPIPHPSILGGYENICPGAANRIIEMAEKEQVHRHKVDDTIISVESRDSKMGIICATVISLSALIAGVIITIVSENTSGQVIGGVVTISGLASIIGTFLKGTSASWKNKEKKSSEDKTDKADHDS